MSSLNGLCPDCGVAALRVYNVVSTHWAVCHDCRNRWCLGSTMFSGWRRESEGDWVANELLLLEYADVVPDPDPSDIGAGT